MQTQETGVSWDARADALEQRESFIQSSNAVIKKNGPTLSLRDAYYFLFESF